VGFVKSCLKSALFWPSANGLAWRKAPFGRFATKYCYLILNHVARTHSLITRKIRPTSDKVG
jgi:hypothetical protein